MGPGRPPRRRHRQAARQVPHHGRAPAPPGRDRRRWGPACESEPRRRSPAPAPRRIRLLPAGRQRATATPPPSTSSSTSRPCKARTPAALPLLEGRPISLARARLLACEGGVIPSVFNYATGEAVELGRAARLPNTALRRKLELEQPGGCAWTGCDRPIAWTEAHHITHWADGGDTDAENLILLCRFHHGRIHTAGWTVEKTGPGQAIITHHEGHGATDAAPGAAAPTGALTPTWTPASRPRLGCLPDRALPSGMVRDHETRTGPGSSRS